MQFFDKSKEMILVTDWSKVNRGIGFILLQKYCSCRPDTSKPLCCDKWKTILCDSRRCTGSETGYAPIEGEALAIVWALKKARLFLLGANFKVINDHKPLLRIFL